MRQESMRSAVYRSFVTCDDPKGVIECGTIRKSKFCPKKFEEEGSLGRVIRRGKKKNQNEEVDDESLRRRSSSLQLNEVAREALNLNRMAGSYSKRSSFDGNSKDIAKDLLKGALDLQESLIMLGKLQESSTNMAKLKKKEQNDHILGFQKPRLSVSGYNNNGCSKDCFDELREAIKEGLAKQSLLLRRRNPDMASTSSTSQSQSSSSSSSIIENSQNLISSSNRPGNSNLIAKLMGLDHIPPRPDSNKQQVKKKLEDVQPPPIVLIKPARFLKPDFDTKEMLKVTDMNTKQMIKAAQKPVKRINQELGLKDMRRKRFKHQEDSFKPKASSAGVPRKKKEEGIQRRRIKPEENTKSLAVSKSNGKTKKETIVPTIASRFQNSQHKRRNVPQNNAKPIKAIKREDDEVELTTPKEIVNISDNADQKDNQIKLSEEKSIVNKIDTKHVLLSSPLFIAYAEEIFNVVVDTKLPSNTTVVDSASENDRRLIIDYAKEFMQERCRSRRMQESAVTLEQLVDEVCKGMASPERRTDRVMRETAADGGLDAVIIRAWDLGRREMDLIVGDIEKMIIRELMDSLITDFQYM